MQLVEQHIIKKSSKLFNPIDEMAYKSKNLYNATLYAVRQYYFQNQKYINYYSLQKDFQNNKQPDYYALPTKISQWIMKMVDMNFKSFFLANTAYKQCPNKFQGKPKIPKYLDKEKGRYLLTFTNQAISKKALKKQHLLKLTGLDISVKTNLTFDQINQVRIVKRNDSYVIEIVYTVNDIKLKENNQKYASIDLGVNNLATVVFNSDKPFIINGKPLKSINHYYNKKKAKLQEFQKNNNRNINKKKIITLTNKRNNKVKDYLHKASRLLVNHLVSNQINTLIIGKNKGWKQDINNGDKNNQNMVQIPFNQFISMLQYKCQLEGITVIIQEESYTSKASFLDNDYIPVYKKGNNTKYTFSGYRQYRGLYKSKIQNKCINADVNGALNILRKAVPNVKFTNGIQVCSTPLVQTIK